MTQTTDGKAAEAYFSRLDPAIAGLLRAAIVAAIAKSSALTAQTAVLRAHASPELIDEITAEIPSIENTALDAAIGVLEQPHGASPASVVGALAAGTAGALASGVTIGKVRGELYHAGSVLGDVEAIASGNPRTVVRRGIQHVFWHSFGRAGRSLFSQFTRRR